MSNYILMVHLYKSYDSMRVKINVNAIIIWYTWFTMENLVKCYGMIKIYKI